MRAYINPKKLLTLVYGIFLALLIVNVIRLAHLFVIDAMREISHNPIRNFFVAALALIGLGAALDYIIVSYLKLKSTKNQMILEAVFCGLMTIVFLVLFVLFWALRLWSDTFLMTMLSMFGLLVINLAIWLIKWGFAQKLLNRQPKAIRKSDNDTETEGTAPQDKDSTITINPEDIVVEPDKNDNTDTQS